ncbi:MAG TPA: ribonuclease J, partial [Candidatus Limnocylindria bacterium]
MASTVRVIPLGGVGEIGKNMMAIEQDNDIVVVDAGLMFPDEQMLGIDIVIPDIRYLRERKDKVKGVLITHAHEDHIGALPYVLRDFPNVPIHGTRLSLGLIKTKLREHKLDQRTQFREIEPGTPFSIGAFRCDSYYVCHSIPDAVGVTI